MSADQTKGLLASAMKACEEAVPPSEMAVVATVGDGEHASMVDNWAERPCSMRALIKESQAASPGLSLGSHHDQHVCCISLSRMHKGAYQLYRLRAYARQNRCNVTHFGCTAQARLFQEYCQVAVPVPEPRCFSSPGLDHRKKKSLHLTDQTQRLLAANPTIFVTIPSSGRAHSNGQASTPSLEWLLQQLTPAAGNNHQPVPDPSHTLVAGPSMDSINMIDSPFSVTCVEAWISTIAWPAEFISEAQLWTQSVLAENGPPSQLQSLTCVFLHALSNNGSNRTAQQVSSIMKESLAQAKFDKHRHSLVSAGVDFNSHYYCPENDPSIGMVRAFIPDFPHLAKRFPQSFLNQKWSETPEPDDLENVLDRSAIFGTAMDFHAMLERDIHASPDQRSLGEDIAKVVAGVVDDQNVPTAFCLLTCTRLTTLLRQKGFDETATILECPGGAVIAMDMRGIRHTERFRLLHNTRLALMRLLGSHCIIGQTMPNRLEGIPCGLVTAFLSI